MVASLASEPWKRLSNRSRDICITSLSTGAQQPRSHQLRHQMIGHGHRRVPERVGRTGAHQTGAGFRASQFPVEKNARAATHCRAGH